jgi:hypothetical protein
MPTGDDVGARERDMPTGFGGGPQAPFRPAAAPPEVFAQAVDALLRHAGNLDQDTLQARHRRLLTEDATTLSQVAGVRGKKAKRTQQERDASKRGLPRVASLQDVDDAFKQLRRDHQFKDPALQASASADDRRHLAVIIDDMRKKAAREKKDMWSDAFVAWYLEHWDGLDLAPATGVYTQPLLEDDGRGGVRRVKPSAEERGKSYQKVLAELYYRLPGLQRYIREHLPELQSEDSEQSEESEESQKEASTLGQKRAAGGSASGTTSDPYADFVFEPGICQRKQLNRFRNEGMADQCKRPRTTSDPCADFVFEPGICQRKQLNRFRNEGMADQRKRGQEKGVIYLSSSSDEEDIK